MPPESSLTASAQDSRSATRSRLKTALVLGLLFTGIFYAVLALETSRSMFHFIADPQSTAAVLDIQAAADRGADLRHSPEAQRYAPWWVQLTAALTDSRFAYDSDSLFPTIGHYYASMPSAQQWVLGLHMLFGGLCMLLGGSQFWPALRRRHPKLHRRLGMIFVGTAQTAMLLSISYLLMAGPADTYAQLTFHVGLWFLAIIVSLALWLALFHVRKGQIAQHMGWMALAYGLLFSAPLTRYDWVGIGMLFPETSFNEANYAMMGLLMAQCLILAYALLCLSRLWSRPRATLQALAWADNLRAALPRWLPLLNLLLLALAATVIYYYLLTPGISASALAERMVPTGVLANEGALFTAALPSRAAYTVLTVGLLMLAPFFLYQAFRLPPQARQLPRGLRLQGLGLGLAAALAALIQCYWAWQLGGPSHAKLAGGTFYLVVGSMQLGFALLLLLAVVRQRLPLLKEWGLFTLIAATMAPTFYGMLALLALIGIPAHYLATGHGYGLATGLASALGLIPGFVYAVYGSASRERAVY